LFNHILKKRAVKLPLYSYIIISEIISLCNTTVVILTNFIITGAKHAVIRPSCYQFTLLSFNNSFIRKLFKYMPLS